MLKVQDFVLALMRHSDPRSSHRSFGVHKIRSLRVTPVPCSEDTGHIKHK